MRQVLFEEDNNYIDNKYKTTVVWRTTKHNIIKVN
jgi:hypothetical protein